MTSAEQSYYKIIPEINKQAPHNKPVCNYDGNHLMQQHCKHFNKEKTLFCSWSILSLDLLQNHTVVSLQIPCKFIQDIQSSCLTWWSNIIFVLTVYRHTAILKSEIPSDIPISSFLSQHGFISLLKPDPHWWETRFLQHVLKLYTRISVRFSIQITLLQNSPKKRKILRTGNLLIFHKARTPRFSIQRFHQDSPHILNTDIPQELSRQPIF